MILKYIGILISMGQSRYPGETFRSISETLTQQNEMSRHVHHTMVASLNNHMKTELARAVAISIHT